MVRESNPGGGEICRTCPDRPWGPPSLLYNGYQVFLGGKKRPRRDADPSPRSSAVDHERVELYLYSPCGPYGLYRASVHVQGCTLPLPLKISAGSLKKIYLFHEIHIHCVIKHSTVLFDKKNWVQLFPLRIFLV
jgi:hypothetical protein